jgi:hypothetical protein
MRYMGNLVITVLMGLGFTTAWTDTQDHAVAEMRSRLALLGRAVIDEAEGRAPRQEGPPYKRSPSEEARYRLCREPREPVREAIDQALKGGTKEERIGALNLYRMLVTTSGDIFPKEPLSPSYRSVLYDLLTKDDRKLTTYTDTLAGALGLFPTSRETILIYMEIAESTTDPKAREDYLLLASDKLGIDLPIGKQTPSLEREKILSEFEAWFAKNKNQIAFDEKGRSVLAGSKVESRPRALRAEDRERLRHDPACVLELMQAGIGSPSTEERTEGLIRKCGEALYGPDAIPLLNEALVQSKSGGRPSLDLQLKIAQVRGKYPVTDAVLLAVAYVAAYDTDPGHRELARTSLDQFGSPDIARVLKGEPTVVHKKMEELGDEVLKHPEK